MDRTSSFFVVLLAILMCLNGLYWGIQAVDSADADDLAMLGQPPAGFTPLEMQVLDQGYRQLERESEVFLYEDGEDCSYIDFDQSPEERAIEIKIDRILDNYPAKVLFVNHESKFMAIQIFGWMCDGTDISCQRAAECFHALTGLGFTLEVRGQWVPSRVNPMTHAWTSLMLEEDGRIQT